MDPLPQASFIPKKPLQMGPLSRAGAAGFGGVLFLFCLFMFVMSIVGAAGVFGYQYLLHGSIASKTASLTKAEGAFNPTVIQELIRIDSRINQAELLLQKHVAPSGIFTFLAAQTLEQVQFDSFSYTLAEDGVAQITLGGQANSFATIALQSDQFGASKVLKNVVFSGILLGAGGKVSFTVVANVTPSLLSYTQNLGNTPALEQATLQPTQPMQDTTTSGGSGQTASTSPVGSPQATPPAFPTQ